MERELISMQSIAQWVGEQLQRTADNIRQRHLDAGQKASGRTAASIRTEVVDEGDGIRGIIWGRAPFTDLEQGQPPGARPTGFYKIIYEWMMAKGIHANPIHYVRQPSERWQPMYTPQERGDRTLAYFIAKKIQEEGTRLWRGEAERPDIYSTEIKELEERIGNRLLSIFSTEIQHIHTNSK